MLTLHVFLINSYLLMSCISPQLAKVIEGHYNDIVERFTIIDCRYPYEFEGGHIKVWRFFCEPLSQTHTHTHTQPRTHSHIYTHARAHRYSRQLHIIEEVSVCKFIAYTIAVRWR